MKDAKKDHYTPQIPLAFQLQRGGFSFRPEDFPEADAAHLRVLREHAGTIRSLVDCAVPALAVQEQAVAAISTAPKDDSHKAIMAQKEVNTNSNVRPHRYFLAEVRGKMSLAIVCDVRLWGVPCRLSGSSNDLRAETLEEVHLLVTHLVRESDHHPVPLDYLRGLDWVRLCFLDNRLG